MAPNVHSFADLLRSAVSEPGTISAAYRQFHTYSIGNQLLAWGQCLARGIQPGPMPVWTAAVATFRAGGCRQPDSGTLRSAHPEGG
jgi:hypothetical protein